MARIVKPQPGPQTTFMATPANVCIYGGAAGGGKSFGLLMSSLRYKNVPGFGCTIFRRNFNQIFSQGGLWDESMKIYQGIRGADPKFARGQWWFRNQNGDIVSKVTFAHIERDEDVHKWQGSQICEIGFDELTHFSEKTFFYMLSRNRSTCGVEPFIRATCNPDADSWVAKFIEWWIDPDTGYPIPERSGKLRWFVRRDEILYWANTKQELWKQFDLKTPEEKAEPRSVTFIMSKLEDNQELLKVNPGYMANLKAMSVIERERLLHGNWKIKAAAGLFFKRSQVGDYLSFVPDDVIEWVRCWDLAATEKTENGDPAFTSGVLMGKRKNGRYIVADVVNKQMSASDVRQTIKHTAQQDIAKYKRVKIRLPKDPGQAGKEQAESYIKFLAGFNVVTVAETGSKEARAEPMAAQWQAGNFDVLTGAWNEEYLQQLENFPDSKFKDMVDASANAFTELETKNVFDLSNLI
nr:MAG TPA: Large subunit terminase [Caudoviricetes sp.]